MTDTRRVVTGFGRDGRSRVISDGPAAARLERPGGATLTEIWRSDHLPAPLDDIAFLDVSDVLPPSAAGLVVRICTFPPANELDADAQRAYARSLEHSYGPETASTHGGGVPGMHRTDTLDMIYILSGELCMVMEDGETTLRPGDTVVQRGAPHAWHNRTDSTVTVLSIMMGATHAE